ncbi:MAG: serine--tRNA ligase, partial [Chloroflexi bacterium]|nr:serine--tRNA ligase [Chloroflexota bacterium]
MLPIRAIREQTEELRAVFARRGVDAPLDAIVELDSGRRELLTEVESMRADRNEAG